MLNHKDQNIIKRNQNDLVHISNIDILNIGNPCNQNCRQCYYNTQIKTNQDILESLLLFNKIKENNTFDENGKFFLYPKEITTSPSRIEHIASNQQDYVLTNGKNLLNNSNILTSLKENNINRIKVTLFPSEEEQLFRNGNSPLEYKEIKEAIVYAIENNFIVETFTMLTPQNMELFPEFYKELSKIGISKVNLLNFIPYGNGKNVDLKYTMNNGDLECGPKIYYE